MTLSDIKSIIEPVLKKHDILKAGIFGSYANENQQSDSDIDILISINSKISLLEFVKIKLELEDLLGKSVDLVEYDSIKPRLKDRILKEEVRVYG